VIYDRSSYIRAKNLCKKNSIPINSTH